LVVTYRGGLAHAEVSVIACYFGLLVGLAWAVLAYHRRWYCPDDPELRCNGWVLVWGGGFFAVIAAVSAFIALSWLLYRLTYGFHPYPIARDLAIAGVVPLLVLGAHLASREVMDGWPATGMLMLGALPPIAVWWWRWEAFTVTAYTCAAVAGAAAMVAPAARLQLMTYGLLLLAAGTTASAHGLRATASHGA
jgi:hypothetical protein